MNKPIKPDITIPQSFAENGVKTDFDDTLLAAGFDSLRPDVLAGDNLNKFIDDTYQGLNYGMAAADAINLINEGETLTVVDGKLTSGASGGGLEIGDIGFTQMAIDETKGKRRVANGQLIIQDQYIELTKRIKATKELKPELFCTESEWQAEVTMSTAGICYKYVIDNEAGTIRLPKYPNYFIGGVNNIATVVGNGMTLGLSNGVANFGLSHNVSHTFVSNGITYGTSVGTSGESYVNASSNAMGVGVTTDPTKSGIEAQIKQEKIVGTYFIQVATGSETEDNIINEIELNNPFSLLDYKYSEYELNNLSWLRSEGQYNSKAIYPAVYDLLLKIYNGTETKAGVSVKLSTASYTDYDFVLNTAEETFRLPVKVKQKFYNNIAPVVGNGMVVGLTNGSQDAGLTTTGSAGILGGSLSTYGQSLGFGQTGSYLSTVKGVGITTDSSKSGIEANLTEQTLYLYFYVGETVQNANLINAGRIEEKLSDCITRNDCKAYIVETYVNGTSGYRTWSDKYHEEWGFLASTSSASTTINYVKAFANTNYNLVVSMSASGTPNVNVGWQTKTTTSFVAYTYQQKNNPEGTHWRACGYIA